MILPEPRLLALTGGWTALGLVTVWQPAWLPGWAGLGLLLLLAAVADAVLTLREPPPQVTRKLMGSLPIGVRSEVRLRVRNPLRRPLTLSVFDHHPPQFAAEGLPAAATIPAHGWAEFGYQVLPRERGVFAFAPAQLRVQSPWRLWRRDHRCGDAGEVHVYPNFAAVMKYALLATGHRLSQLGIRVKRRRGQGMDFHQLREYREGDALRQVDWRATSRTRKLISRDYQDERDQQVVFLIDCGRRMRTQDGELSHFDHTLNAVLLLSHVALRQGDAVGLMTFSGPRRYLEPVKGAGMVNRVLKTLFDLQPGTQPPDYLRAAETLLARQRKRALVVLVTNLRDEDSDDLLPALRVLRRRHLVLVASLREQALDDLLAQPVEDFDQALERSAAQQYLTLRRAAHERVAAGGAFLVDVTPERLPVQLVNRYLDIKLSGAL